MFKQILFLVSLFCLLSSTSFARSTHNISVGVMGMGNIQLLDVNPEINIGPGGGMYFDYRFNQRFSLTLDAWGTIHSGTGASSGDGGIALLGIPTATIKMYFMDDEASKWDPYAGLGIGAYAITGSDAVGANGLGLGAQIEVGFDYLISDSFSVGFAGVFRSAGIITGLSGNNSATAIIPFSLAGKAAYHF
ncbi:MAG: hypothetical protein ACD_73C00227G0001 [uncultured bacterium]|nr:MAG: hypothetical protein ACD_73C00227G0001 [uncultured bacterium]